MLFRSVHITDRVLKTLGINSQLSSFHDALVPRGMRRFNLGSAKTLGEPIPAGNGLFTARSLARMYAMIAGGGEIDGVRLLSEDTIDRLSRTEPAPGRHAVVPVDLRWRLGYHGVYSRRGFEPGAFGHFGVGGSGAWALPDLELAFALVTNGGARSPLMRLSGEVVDRARRLVSA